MRMEGGELEKFIFLGGILKEEIAKCVKDITQDGKPSRSHQDQIEFEWRVRFWLENQFVPHVLAVACGVLDFDASLINQKMPELIRSSVSTLPKDAEFLSGIGKNVDPELWEVLTDNIGLGPDSEPAVAAFNDALDSIFS